jgi:tetratricopeptide (TPR) repeat protein
MGVTQLHVTCDPSGWQAHWSCGGRGIDPVVPLDAAAERELRTLSRRFLGQFEQGERPFVDPADLSRIGRSLFNTFFAPVWPAVQEALGAGPHSLLLKCGEPDLLNLPWELVELHAGLPLGCDSAWGLLRVPEGTSAGVESPPDPGPVRLLFLAAAPADQPQLDFEREEDAMLQATARLSQSVIVLPFAETGGIDELAGLVAEHRPHVLHLSGHASVDAKGVGRFAFEDERGQTDSRPINEIVSHVFRGSAVRCVVLNACQSAQAAAAGLAQKLVEAGVPLVLGWAASVVDDRATEFATAFYRFLARGDGVATAAARAREHVWRSGRKRKGDHELVDATFALPQLYAVGPAVELVDRTAPPRPYAGPKTVRTILEDGIKGLEKGFIGRRRIQQQLLPALRDGAVTFAVLYGLGGMGKSTLATRAANRLKEAGFTVYGVRAAAGSNPAESGQATWIKLLDALGRAFLFAGRQDLYKLLTTDKLPSGQRLRLAVQGLRDLRVVFVLDNLEDALDVNTRQIVDSTLREAYQVLSRDLTAGSRVLVTSRYLPAETPTDQPTVWYRDLAELKEAEFYKFLRQDEVVFERMTKGELAPELLHRLHQIFGGTPGFLLQVRTVLRTADPDSLVEEALAEDLPLEAARQQYIERLFLPRLYAVLPTAAQRLASRLAVSELPLSPDGLARLLGTDEAAAVAAVEAGVNYGLVQSFAEEGLPTLYHPPGLVRFWLASEERLSADEHRAADQFLAQFWRDKLEQGLQQKLRVPSEIGLMVCRVHSKRAGDMDLFRWATSCLAVGFYRLSNWRLARTLLEDISEINRDGRCWHQLALINLHEGNYAAAREQSAKALAKWQAIGDRAGEAAAWHQLASIDLNEGNYTAARDKFAKALATRQAVGDRAGEAATWHQLAAIDLKEGNYAAAREQSARALALIQAIGDRRGEADTWAQLASIQFKQGNFPLARDQTAKALAIRQAIGDRDGEADAWAQLASIDLWEGNYAAAREQSARALTMMQAIGDRPREAKVWDLQALIDQHEGNYPAARIKAAKALALMQAIGDRRGEAITWCNLGTIDLHEGNYAAARDEFAKALEIMQAIGDRVGEAAAWHQLASIDLNEGNYAAARDRYAKVLAIRQAIGDRAGEAETLHNLASIDLEEGKYAVARDQFAKSLQTLRAIGYRVGEAASLHQLGLIELREGNYATARDLSAKALAMRQAIGDRVGEADSWSQLSFIAWQTDRRGEAVRLLAVGYALLQDIRSSKSKECLLNLSGMCESLGFEESQFQELIKVTYEDYANNRGRQLLLNSFPELKESFTG